MAVNRNSEKFIAARDSLPRELQPFYEKLVEDYAFITTMHHG